VIFLYMIYLLGRTTSFKTLVTAQDLIEKHWHIWTAICA